MQKTNVTCKDIQIFIDRYSPRTKRGYLLFLEDLDYVLGRYKKLPSIKVIERMRASKSR